MGGNVTNDKVNVTVLPSPSERFLGCRLQADVRLGRKPHTKAGPERERSCLHEVFINFAAN